MKGEKADGAVGPDGAHLRIVVFVLVISRAGGPANTIAVFGVKRFQEPLIAHGSPGAEAEEFEAARRPDRLIGENGPIPSAEIGRGDCQAESLLALADRLLGLLALGDV